MTRVMGLKASSKNRLRAQFQTILRDWFFLKAAELCSVKMFWVKNTLNCRKYLKNQEGVLVFY